MSVRPIETLTFDFGNTLVPVDRAGLQRVVAATAERVVARLGPFEAADFLRVWAEERDRQFREELPRFREVDIGDRFVRVLARLRGMTAPSADDPWDQATVMTRSTADEIDWAVETYSGAFVEAMPPPEGVIGLLERLASRYRLAILSNWPLAATVDRYAEAAGWTGYLAAIVISQRVGIIKPHPAIFRAAESALGLAEADGPTILHVGDDWAADVVGAKGAGWQAALVHGRPADSPLPSSSPDGTVVPDMELSRLTDLEAALAG